MPRDPLGLNVYPIAVQLTISQETRIGQQLARAIVVILLSS
jgi:hypothetical protein